MTDIILVHGAFGGGWCWRRVVPLLTAHGHRVMTPTLTGLGERRHLMGPSVDLDCHISDITGVLTYEEAVDAVLVCHSYGGLPATGAADRMPERLHALVYLDAYIAEDGLSGLEQRNARGFGVPLQPPKNGAVPPPPSTAFIAGGDDAAWMTRMMTPHPEKTMTQKARLTGAFRTVPVKHYHRALRFPAPYFDAMVEAAEADPAWHATRRDMDHDMMVSEPEWTATAILAAVPR